MKQEKLINNLKSVNISENTVMAIASERIYQDIFWNEDTTESKGIHNESEFLIFISDYLDEAITIISRGSEPTVSINASNKLRCIAAMVYNCSEVNNWNGKLLSSFSSINFNKENKLNVCEILIILKDLVNKGIEIAPKILLKGDFEIVNKLGWGNSNKYSFNAKDELQQILCTIFSLAIHSMEMNFNPMRDDERVVF